MIITIKELIEQLNKFDSETKVVLSIGQAFTIASVHEDHFKVNGEKIVVIEG